MLDLNIEFEPTETTRKERIKVSENELAGAMSGHEAQLMAVALLNSHGADAFKHVADAMLASRKGGGQ